MRKLSSVLLFLACGLTFGACGSSEVKVVKEESNAVVDNVDMDVTMDITVGGDNAVSIPDPAQTKGDISIMLQEDWGEDEDEWLNDKLNIEDGEDAWGGISDEEYTEICKGYISGLYTDLSFVGFEDKVLVTSFAVGTMTEKDSSTAKLHYVRKGNEETKKGNCLALFVSDGGNPDISSEKYTDEEYQNIDTEKDNNYFLVIDYGKKTFYKVKTNLYFASSCYTPWHEMQMVDLTGDGFDELVVKQWYNKNLMVEVYTYNRDSQDLEKICSNWYEEEMGGIEESSISFSVKDDYMVAMEAKDIGFSETVSLLGVGYKVKDLEIGEGDDGDDDAMPHTLNLWKNKKLQYEHAFAGPGMIQDLYVYVNDEGVAELILEDSVLVLHKWDYIGTLTRHYQYNTDKEKFVLAGAEFEKYDPNKK